MNTHDSRLKGPENEPMSLFRFYRTLQSDELVRGLLFFLSFFFLIGSFGVVRPIRSSLLIASMGASVLPYLWALTGFSTLVFVILYGRLLARYSAERMLLGSIVFFTSTLLLIRVLFSLEFSWAAALLYIWSDLVSVATTEQVWSLMDSEFNECRAKRLYGIIGSGGSLGGMVGSMAVAGFAHTIRAEDLIYVCGASLALVSVPVLLLQRRSRPSPAIIESEFSKGELFKGFKLVIGSGYLKLILLVIVLTQVVSNVVDLQFNSVVELSYGSTASRTHFLAGFFTLLNAASLVFMLVVTPIIQNFLGIRAGLLTLPLVNVLNLGVAALFPGVFTTSVLKLFDKGLNYSLNRASKELLYIPTSREVKFRAKAVLDMFAYRFSEIAGAAMVIPLLRFMDWKSLGYLNGALLLMEVAAIIVLTRQYHLLTEKITPMIGDPAQAKRTARKKVWNFRKPRVAPSAEPGFASAEPGFQGALDTAATLR